jgi:hypothetical protein
MILYYRLMTKWSGLGDNTKLSRMGLSQQPSARHGRILSLRGLVWRRERRKQRGRVVAAPLLAVVRWTAGHTQNTTLHCCPRRHALEMLCERKERRRQGTLSYGPPWAHYLGGTRTDYSVGPWDYPTCATRHLIAWGARTTVEKYSDGKLYIPCTV